MAVVERVARIRFSGAAGAFREWTATASVLDTAAGGSVTVTTTITTGGIAPAQADTLALSFHDASGASVRTVTLTPGLASQTTTFHFTSNGNAGGSVRAGTVEIALRAAKTTGGPTATYDWSTRAGATKTAPSTFVGADDQGWVRATTTATISASNVAAGGAEPAVFAYTSPSAGNGGDSVFARVAFAAPLYVGVALSVTVGAAGTSTTGSATQTFDATFTRAVDNRFPAAATAVPVTFTVPNSTLTGQPTTVATATAKTITVDPRLTRSPLFQLDDNTFGSPPASKHDPRQRRLTSQQGFLGSRTVNARGEGVNGITYDVTLTPDKPGQPVTNTGLVTAARGGQDGWSPQLLAWASALPGGVWRKSFAVTGPSDITGAAYTVQAAGTKTDYFLVAVDPEVFAQALIGNPGATGRHWSPGQPLVTGAFASNGLTGQVAVPEEAQARYYRLGPATGRVEYLDGTHAWQVLVPEGGPPRSATAHTLVESPAGSGQWTHTVAGADTVGWGTADIRVRVRLVIEGAVYQDDAVLVATEDGHAHDTADPEPAAGPAFDPVAFALHGVISQR